MVFACPPPSMEAPQGVYRQRDPRASPLYRLVVDHFEDLKSSYSDRFEETYGPWQPHWDSTVEKFRRCGDLHYGFARVYCRTCRHAFVVPLSCRTRGFCPSCEAKRRAVWAQHVIEDILPANLPYRMIVFTVPKCLRRIFMRERKLLGDFARVAYDCTYQFFSEQFPGVEGKPYFVCAIQTFSDFAYACPTFTASALSASRPQTAPSTRPRTIWISPRWRRS